MTTLNEGKHAGEFIVSEANVGGTGVSRSRDAVTVVSGQNLIAGSVVGKITASEKYAKYDNAAVDGTEVAAGILFDAVDASTADADGVALVRDCEYHAGEVDWNTQDAAAQTAGTADLLAIGVIAR